MKSIIVATILLSGLWQSGYVYGQSSAQMPTSEQNALVAKYCAVCHDDAHRNGGLSLDHFDAATVEPSLAAMMVAKLKTGAIGASGLPRPDAVTEQALRDALSARSARATEWVMTRTNSALSVGMVRQTSPSEVYRLNLTCQVDGHDAEMQLSWAPDPGKSGREVSIAVDGQPPVSYLVEGHESMGNGMKRPDGGDVVTASPAAVTLYSTRSVISTSSLSAFLPLRTLTVSNVMPNETVEFRFDAMPVEAREALSRCSSQDF